MFGATGEKGPASEAGQVSGGGWVGRFLNRNGQAKAPLPPGKGLSVETARLTQIAHQFPRPDCITSPRAAHASRLAQHVTNWNGACVR
jgi:hypothetical protein